jgi:hypothetical protein
MIPAVIFFINNLNFHSGVCNGRCLFLHTPHPGGVDVFEHQAPNNHRAYVHVPNPCIDLSFVPILHPFTFEIDTAVLHMSFCVSNKQIVVFCFLPNKGCPQHFFFIFSWHVSHGHYLF